ncbi:MAG: glycoside hydrolase family 78 protein [Tannerellaceae bacterium]|jgi:alpha-L-rhamnosidase|nr:glycoside hydrolase family 78 protein [Tannerellaceae bacterium]
MNKAFKLLLLFIFTGFAAICDGKGTNTIFVQDLTCEYLVDPLGIDVPQPRFAWKIVQTGKAKKGQLQTAYQILIASSSEKLAENEGDIWNSEKVQSGQSVHITYNGKPLESMQQCWWKVKIWNNYGEVTSWSNSARFGVGILQPSGWKGQWIGDKPDLKLKEYVEYVDAHHTKKEDGYDAKIVENPPLLPSPLLRKSFSVTGSVKSALLYVSSLGYNEIFFNGERIGDHQLAPEWTDYYRRVQYQVYDLTAQVASGTNALAAVLADGWYLGELGPVRWRWSQEFPFRGFYGLDRRLIAQLCIVYSDGSRQIISTDGSWKINPDGYIRTADNFVGQTIDARKIISGWNLPGFDDSSWANAYVDNSVDKNLEAQKNEPIRIHRELKPIKINAWKDKYIVNFGQNIAGWCALKIKGKAGTVVTLRHGEWLNNDGSIYTYGLGQAKQTDVFILSGGDDCFEPRFTYHGFQYVEISGLDEKPAADMIVARAVSSDPEVTGTFECSNPKLNRLFANILWTQRNNMHSVPTDCPQRDERCGWLGDAQVFCQNSIFNMNMAAFYTKFTKDLCDAVAPNGQFYSIVPSVRHGNFGVDWYGGPAWADAGVIIPWRVYENYGDRRILEEHYVVMKHYIESILSENPDYLWKEKHANYNDWLNANTFSNPPEEYNTTRGGMPDDVFNTAFFAHSAHLLSEIATILGNKDDAALYTDLRNKIAAAFVKNFVDENGVVEGNSQGAYAIALHFDLLPENLQVKAFENLLKCIEEYDYRISTGFVTTPMMMKELVRRGRADIAYKFLESERFPSWIYAVNQGATTVWERWDAYVKGRGINPSDMNSFNHYSIGSVGEWIYRNVLGINPDIKHPGYEHFTIRPLLGGTLVWAKGSYNSIYGEIAVSWKIEGNSFILNVKIPVNTTATVVLPNNETKETGSGEYTFKLRIKS